jgi:hypothetical protein
MDETLLKKYRKYANTEEAFAILFVKKNIAQSKGHWVDVDACQRYEMSSDNFHFRFVFGGLYPRKIQPKYPSKSIFTHDGKFNERSYLLMVRAITWETANKDIEQQKSKQIKVSKFNIKGVSYDKNKNNKNYFLDSAPPEIKALADNLSNRTNPLWDEAMKYTVEPDFVYKIKQIHIF